MSVPGGHLRVRGSASLMNQSLSLSTSMRCATHRLQKAKANSARLWKGEIERRGALCR
jgi:hypothetical protein